MRARINRADPRMEQVRIDLRLRWTARAYAWIGTTAQLDACS